MPGDGDPKTVTWQDLTEFLPTRQEQPKSHTSELSLKFEKASTRGFYRRRVRVICLLSAQSRERAQNFFSWKLNERN